MGTNESRGWQECDGERHGRVRVLAVGRKHEEKLRAANTAGNDEGRSERVSYGVRFGAAQDRIEHTGRGEEVVRSAAENDAAAGDL